MTPFQLFERLEDFFRTALWEGTANLIFDDGAVNIVQEIPIQQMHQWQGNHLFIIDDGAIPDTEYPGLLTQKIQLSLYVSNTNDPMGRGPVMGACRTPNTTPGAGALEVWEDLLLKLIETVSLTTKIMIIEKSLPKKTVVSRNFPTLISTVKLEALTTIY